MEEAGVGGGFHTGGGAVAGAVVGGAEEGASSHDAFGGAWFVGVVGVFLAGAEGVSGSGVGFI